MSVKIMTAVWDLGLPHTDKLVLLALADNANDEGDCWPSISTIASKCCMHRATVMRCIAELESKGYLVRSSEPGRNNAYRLHPSQPATSRNVQLVAQGDGGSRTARRVPVAARDGGSRRERPRTIIEPSSEPSENRHVSRRARVPRQTLDPEWTAEFKLTYPRRAGDLNWRGGWAAAHARLAEGHALDELMAGVRRYAAYIRAKGDEGTEFVQQVSRFLGPGKPFLQDWAPPKSRAQRQQDANVTAAQEWLSQEVAS